MDYLLLDDISRKLIESWDIAIKYNESEKYENPLAKESIPICHFFKAESYFHLGVSHSPKMVTKRKEYLKKAVEEWDICERLEPFRTDLQVKRAFAHLYLGQYKKAYEYCLKVLPFKIVQNPCNANVFVNYALIFKRLGDRYGDSGKHFKKEIKETIGKDKKVVFIDDNSFAVLDKEDTASFSFETDF